VVQLENQLQRRQRTAGKLRAVDKPRTTKKKRASRAGGGGSGRGGSDGRGVWDPDKRYYTDEELCELFDCSKRTTKRWRDTNQIGFLRAPGSQLIRYSRAQLEAFEKKIEHKAATGRRQ